MWLCPIPTVQFREATAHLAKASFASFDGGVAASGPPRSACFKFEGFRQNVFHAELGKQASLCLMERYIREPMSDQPRHRPT
jgi:hypothetical protein